MLTVRSVRANPTRIWGMTNRERTSRIASTVVASEQSDVERYMVVNDDYIFDPLLFNHLLGRSDAVVCKAGVPVLATLATERQAAGVEAAMRGEQSLCGSIERIAVDDCFTLYNHKLRKREHPLLMRLDPATVRSVERATYKGAYKGVTDVLTKYLWPEWALALTRLAAWVGMSPNMVTAIGALNCVAATALFWNGRYWLGMIFALIFMVLDTVDGKLARCTLTSSRIGNFLDHGIDMIHPPFWWWAWAHGLSAAGLPLSEQAFAWTMAAVVIGYILQRMIEKRFKRRFGFQIHVWTKTDSDFRLIAARRNPNMVILFVAMLFQRPDLGIAAVAIWTVISLIFHAVRLVQAKRRQERGEAVLSWLS